MSFIVRFQEYQELYLIKEEKQLVKVTANIFDNIIKYNNNNKNSATYRCVERYFINNQMSAIILFSTIHYLQLLIQ